MQTEPTIEPNIEAPANDEDAIRALVSRLSRPHKSGGVVIERAALLAEGSAATAAIAWIVAHDGVPERPSTRARRTACTGRASPAASAPAPASRCAGCCRRAPSAELRAAAWRGVAHGPSTPRRRAANAASLVHA